MQPSGSQPNVADPRTQNAALARVKAAEERIQAARKELNKAAVLICDVRGLANEWTKIGHLDNDARMMYYQLEATADQAMRNGVLDLDRDELNDEDKRLLNIPPPPTDPFYTENGDTAMQRAREAAFKQDVGKAILSALSATQMWAIAGGPGWSSDVGHKRDLAKLQHEFNVKISLQPGSVARFSTEAK